MGSFFFQTIDTVLQAETEATIKIFLETQNTWKNQTLILVL